MKKKVLFAGIFFFHLFFHVANGGQLDIRVVNPLEPIQIFPFSNPQISGGDGSSVEQAIVAEGFATLSSQVAYLNEAVRNTMNRKHFYCNRITENIIDGKLIRQYEFVPGPFFSTSTPSMSSTNKIISVYVDITSTVCSPSNGRWVLVSDSHRSQSGETPSSYGSEDEVLKWKELDLDGMCYVQEEWATNSWSLSCGQFSKGRRQGVWKTINSDNDVQYAIYDDGIAVSSPWVSKDFQNITFFSFGESPFFWIPTSVGKVVEPISLPTVVIVKNERDAVIKMNEMLLLSPFLRLECKVLEAEFANAFPYVDQLMALKSDTNSWHILTEETVDTIPSIPPYGMLAIRARVLYSSRVGECEEVCFFGFNSDHVLRPLAVYSESIPTIIASPPSPLDIGFIRRGTMQKIEIELSLNDNASVTLGNPYVTNASPNIVCSISTHTLPWRLNVCIAPPDLHFGFVGGDIVIPINSPVGRSDFVYSIRGSTLPASEIKKVRTWKEQIWSRGFGTPTKTVEIFNHPTRFGALSEEVDRYVFDGVELIPSVKLIYYNIFNKDPAALKKLCAYKKVLDGKRNASINVVIDGNVLREGENEIRSWLSIDPKSGEQK